MKHYFSTDGSWGASADLAHVETDGWPEWWRDAIENAGDTNRRATALAILSYVKCGVADPLIADYIEQEVCVPACELKPNDRFTLAGVEARVCAAARHYASDGRGNAVEVEVAVPGQNGYGSYYMLYVEQGTAFIVRRKGVRA